MPQSTSAPRIWANLDPLLYKQFCQLRNALRRLIRRPEQLLTLIFMLFYGGFMLVAVSFILFAPFPTDLATLLRPTNERAALSDAADPSDLTEPDEQTERPDLTELAELTDMLGTDPPDLAELQALLNEELTSLRGAVTLLFLFFATTAAFRSTLLKFTPADVDILFTTPISLQRVLVNRLGFNYLRNAGTSFLFWGGGVALLLRLAGYSPFPSGLWGLAAIWVLFSSIDQAVAMLHLIALRRDLEQREAPRQSQWMLWLVRGALLLIVILVLLVLMGGLARFILNDWRVLTGLFGVLGSPVLRLLLLPLSLTADLLLVPVQITTPPGLAMGTLLLLHLLIMHQLMRQIRLGGTGVLLEPALAPAGRPSQLDELIRAARFNPVRLFQIIWRGEWDRAVADQQRIPARITPYGTGASVHEWRRLQEFARVPLRNLFAFVLLIVVPLMIYDPTEPYNLGRLIAAIFFATSIATQLFNDTGDHLRYTDLELSAPISRWQLLWYVQSPRLLLYWGAGVLFLLAVATLSNGSRWLHVPLLGLWYPLILMTMLAMRGAVVFFYPAAATLSNVESDPLQALFVTLINTASFGVVAMIILIPFSVASFLVQYFELSIVLIWLILLGISGTICIASCLLLHVAYRRYEPTD